MCVSVCCALFHSKIFTIKWLNIIYAHVWKKGWHKFPCRNETKQHSTYVPACRSTNFHVIKLNYFIQSAHLKQRLWLSVFFFSLSPRSRPFLSFYWHELHWCFVHKKSEPKNKYGNFNAKLLILEMHLNNYYVLSSIDFSHKSPKMAQIHVSK